MQKERLNISNTYRKKSVRGRADLEAEKQAADYVAAQLKSHGYEVEYQYFPVADQYIADVSFADGDFLANGGGTKW